MKPIIGVVPLVDEAKNSLWMLPGYMEGVEKAGGVPVMLPLTSEEETIDILLVIMFVLEITLYDVWIISMSLSFL